MNFLKRTGNIMSFIGIIILGFLIIAVPAPCKEGIFKGIIVCGRVIIPSLYPFTMCVFFLMRCGVTEKLRLFSKPVDRIWVITLLSLIGGYPVGARLLSNEIKEYRITQDCGKRALNYCINAGPAIIIGGIGETLFGSRKVGIILFVSQILPSLLFSAFLRPKEKTKIKAFPKAYVSFADNFVLSATDAAAALINICVFVILFFGLNAYLEYFNNPLLRTLSLFTVVTGGVMKTKNIYLISFLLGFSGFCVWCQIFSAFLDIKINFGVFFISRLSHASLSTLFTFILLKLFPVSLKTYSNGVIFDKKFIFSTPELSASMLIMSLIFVISLKTKNKILEDII